jgi:hypothetical protein
VVVEVVVVVVVVVVVGVVAIKRQLIFRLVSSASIIPLISYSVTILVSILVKSNCRISDGAVN